MSDERQPTATPVHNPATMVLILSAWTAPDGSLEIRISKNVDGGARRDTMWVDTPEAAGDAVRQAVEDLTSPPD